ncbi:MAG: type II toxin-antitoxin system RelE/ParE family toxin [Treponema sp.]|nr:type II toxin-antitoxin system RelE/ParE family toxin [Treponema sp.]
MRIFRNTWFAQFASKEGVSDSELKEMVKQLEAGQAEAYLVFCNIHLM